jgi:hypothetical protein
MPVKVRPTIPTIPTVRPLLSTCSTFRNGRFCPRKSRTTVNSSTLLRNRMPNSEYPMSSSAKIAKNP